MKKTTYLLLLTLVVALTGCKDDNEIVNPTIAIEAAEVTATSLSFTLTPTNASSCAYFYVEGNTAVPQAKEILENGFVVDAKTASKQTLSELKPDTEYTIVAAVGNGSVAKASAPLKMRTAQLAAPTVTLEAVSTTHSSITFSIQPVNATACAYLLVKNDKVPTAEDVLEDGESVSAGENSEQTIHNLEAGITYTVYAAVSNGAEAVLSEALTMTTDLDDGYITEIYGRRWSRFNYGFNIYTRGGEQVFLDMYLEETSVAGVLPEGDYPVKSIPEPVIPAEESCVAAEGSFISYDPTLASYALLSSGMVSIRHLDNGYVVTIDVTDTEGNRVYATYEGYVPPQFDLEFFSNPPIPYNDVTVETTLTYVGGQHYSNPGTSFSFWMETADGPYSIYFNLLFPQVKDGIIPEGVYTMKEVDYETDEDIDDLVIFAEEDFQHAQLEGQHYMRILEGSTLTVEHLEGAYRLVLDIENELKTKIKATWEGQIQKHWDADPDINHPGSGETIVDLEIKGKSLNFNNYEFYIKSEDKSAFLDIHCPGSVYSVLPEGEYIVDPNADPISGSSLSEYYLGPNSTLTVGGVERVLASGTLVVAHLEEGYDVYLDVKDANGNRLKGAYAGIIEPNSRYDTFNNPPIPYNDITIDTEFTSVTGSHDAVLGPDGYFDLYFTTADGPYEIHLSLESPVVYDGILPAGTYTLDGTELKINEYSSMTLKGFEANHFTSAVLNVEHLEEGYALTLHVEDVFKTKLNASWSGLITKTENCMYFFENPGYDYPADYECVFTEASIGGLDQVGGRYVTFTNDHGDKIKVSLNEHKVSETEITPGRYCSVSWYDGSEGFTYYGNNTTLTMVDVPNPYPFYPSGGYIDIQLTDGIYTVKINNYIWKDGHKLFRATFTGPIE